MIKTLLMVFIGSGIGGALRYTVSQVVKSHLSTNALSTFPWATFAVNVIGCFLIGFIYSVTNGGYVNISADTKAMLTAGFCGGLTTFSTFTYENLEMLQSGNIWPAILYISLSLIVGLLAAYAGTHIAIR